MATRYVTGGDKLAARLNEIARNLKKGGTVRVGVLEGATYPDGKSVAMVAAVNEFGAPSKGIPPRPAFRNMVAEHQDEWPDAIAQTLVANDYDTKRTLGQVGAAVGGQLRQSIIDTNEPPNAPATIRAKGSSKPLVDSGHLLQSIDFEVETSS